MNITKIAESITKEAAELNKLLEKKADIEAKIEVKNRLLEQKNAALNMARLAEVEGKLGTKGVSLDEVVDAVVNENFIALQRKIDSREEADGGAAGGDDI